ncbi:Innexin inx1 [Blattella germanica]|nr:Innexin inx1 [Blattella germanica]
MATTCMKIVSHTLLQFECAVIELFVSLELLRRHNLYAMRYWFCEALCLVNIILQLYFMNHFFDGEFFSYGLRVMQFSEQSQEERVDPMVYVFPRVTKCTFYKYGPSGSIQKHDSLCVLPLNIVNEKTYIFLWFWYIILATLLGLLVVYRALIIAMPSIRPKLLHARNRMVPREVAAAISRKTDVGDWWILYMLGRNMDPLIYREVIAELAKKIDSNAP